MSKIKFLFYPSFVFSTWIRALQRVQNKTCCNTDLKTVYSLTTTRVKLPFLGVCWRDLEQMCLWCFAATSWSSTLLFSSSPFGLSYLHTPAAVVTYSLPSYCPSTLTSSIGFFFLLQLWETLSINTAAKLCSVSFSFHVSRIAT